MRVVGLLLSLAGLAAAQERRLTGRIKTRLPDTVTVRLMDGDSVVREKRLGDDGAFAWRRLKPGIYRLVTSSESHARLDRTVNLYHPRRDVTVTLEPGVTLRGKVVRRNVPAGKTIVSLDRREATCGGDGSFILRNCWPGKRTLQIHHNYGMVGEDETDIHRIYPIILRSLEIRPELILEPDQDVRFSAQLPAGVDEVEGQVHIAGRAELFLFHVHRGKQGQSRMFLGNRGKFYDYSARRKARFVRVPGIWKGAYRFSVRAHGCKQLDLNVSVDGPTDVSVELIALRGRTVTIDPPDGKFRVHPCGIDQENLRGFLREGTRHVTLISDRFLPSKRTLRITHGLEPFKLAFDLKPAPVVTGTLAGVMMAGIWISPPTTGVIAGRVEGATTKHATVDDGRFSVGGLPPGRYDVWLTDLKLATFELGTESITLDLKLPR